MIYFPAVTSILVQYIKLFEKGVFLADIVTIMQIQKKIVEIPGNRGSSWGYRRELTAQFVSR